MKVTLPEPAEPLSEAEELRVNTCAYHLAGSPGNCDAGMVRDLIAIIRKRFPKPAPVLKTNEELAAVILCSPIDRALPKAATDALRELVRRANGPKP